MNYGQLDILHSFYYQPLYNQYSTSKKNIEYANSEGVSCLDNGQVARVQFSVGIVSLLSFPPLLSR